MNIDLRTFKTCVGTLELGGGGGGGGKTYLGSVEDVLHGQHGHDGEHLVTTAQVD